MNNATIMINNTWIFVSKKLIIAGTLLALCSNAGAQTWYRQSGGSVTETGKHYSSAVTDSSGVLVADLATYNLSNATIITTSNSTSTDLSSTAGLNAGVRTSTNSVSNFAYDTISTTGSGANGLYAIGAGSSISMTNGVITTTGRRAHGLDVTYTATAMLNNVNISTINDTASAVATDCGGGTINITGGILTTSGIMSAGVYSTGTINVTNATVTSKADNGAVIDVSGIISMTNTRLIGAQNGLMVHNTIGIPNTATMNMDGGYVTANGGSAFYDTAATANISISNGVIVNATSGDILQAVSSSTASITASAEILTGNIYADGGSQATTVLQNATALTGVITNSSVSIDGTSSWTLTGDAHITTLTDASGVSITALTVSNITGNGNSVYYVASLPGNSWLAHKSYSLASGGCLLPEGSICSTTAVATIANENTELYISPNPASDKLIINYTALYEGADVQVISMDGTVRIKATLLPANTTDIDVNHLNNGVYMVVILNGSTKKTMRFVKQ